MPKPKPDMAPIIACVELAARSGGSQFQIGYLHDDVPMEEAGWYAEAFYQGARLIADNKPSPEAAAEALAVRILEGGQCLGCGETVTTRPGGDGCRWVRVGDRWEMGCG